MNYKHCCVIDAAGNYKTLVLVLEEPDENGQARDVIQSYKLIDGEQLVDAAPPALRPHAGAEGLIKPIWVWGQGTWAEDATPEQIAAWEAEHPAPEPVAQPPSNEDLAAENKLLKAQLAATVDRQDFIEDCMAEMAMQVYNV